jgi:hypothetical protein
MRIINTSAVPASLFAFVHNRHGTNGLREIASRAPAGIAREYLTDRKVLSSGG